MKCWTGDCEISQGTALGEEETQLARLNVFPFPSTRVAEWPTVEWIDGLVGVRANALGVVTTNARAATATAPRTHNERCLTVAPPARLSMRREAFPLRQQ